MVLSSKSSIVVVVRLFNSIGQRNKTESYSCCLKKQSMKHKFWVKFIHFLSFIVLQWFFSRDNFLQELVITLQGNLYIYNTVKNYIYIWWKSINNINIFANMLPLYSSRMFLSQFYNFKVTTRNVSLNFTPSLSWILKETLIIFIIIIFLKNYPFSVVKIECKISCRIFF